MLGDAMLGDAMPGSDDLPAVEPRGQGSDPIERTTEASDYAADACAAEVCASSEPGAAPEPPSGRGVVRRRARIGVRRAPGRRGMPRLRLSLALGLVLLGCIGTVGLTGLATWSGVRDLYTLSKTLGQSGAQHLQTAEGLLKQLAQNPLDDQAIMGAGREFGAAYDDFTRLNELVQRIPDGAEWLPKYGGLVASARRLLPLAAELSQAGMLGCDAGGLLASKIRNPLDQTAHGITAADFALVQQDIGQMVALATVAVSQLDDLQPDDLQFDPRIQAAFSKVHALLPGLADGVNTLRTVLALAPELLGIGKPTNFLLEVLDSTELRPGGGFIGSYGIATVAGGLVQGLHFQDIDLLDSPYKFGNGYIAVPPVYSWFDGVYGRWGLRDSNLDADFPTSARNGEELYHTEGGTESLSGVIAITPWLIRDALAITGPIYVDEYNETITAANLIDRIHYHQLGAQEGPGYTPDPTGHSSLRKRFTSYLFDHFFARIRQIAGTAMPQFTRLFVQSLKTKDLQVYFDSRDAEDLLAKYHLASTIQAPATGDSLMTVDANIIANKANDFITYTLQDQIALDEAGNAVHHTTLTYAWPESAESLKYDYGYKYLYQDYVRVYVPPRSTLQAQDGWEAQPTGIFFGRAQWAGVYTLKYGQTGEITLTWVVPHAATHDSAGWHYRLLLQHQAGLTWNLALHVALPACAHVGKDANGLTAPASLLPTSAVPLVTDETVGVDYTC